MRLILRLRGCSVVDGVGAGSCVAVRSPPCRRVVSWSRCVPRPVCPLEGVGLLCAVVWGDGMSRCGAGGGGWGCGDAVRCRFRRVFEMLCGAMIIVKHVGVHDFTVVMRIFV